jgi:hypothetical protein
MEAMVGVLHFSCIFAGAHEHSAFSYQRWLFVVLHFSRIFAGAREHSAFSYQRWLFVVLHFSCIFTGAHDLVFAFGQRWLFAVRSFYPSPLLFSSHFPRRSSHAPSSFLLSSPSDFT